MVKSIVIACNIILAIIFLVAIHDNPAHADHGGHVQMNVWRGPSKGHKKHKFAPWGYYAKLPADEGKKHHW